MILKPVQDFFLLSPLSTAERFKIYSVLGVTFVLRLFFAALFPITNDEAYYWDWSLVMKLSYFDHPPGVSYITWISRTVSAVLNLKTLSPHFEVRLLAPFLGFIGALFLIHCSLLCAGGGIKAGSVVGQDKTTAGSRVERLLFDRAMLTAILIALIPGISFLGVFALPDIGLMAATSGLLYRAFLIQNRNELGVKDGLFFGLFLGLSGLFKYHALLIGGGISLGLFWTRYSQLHRHEQSSILEFLGKETAFWFSAVMTGGLLCLPVWLWNYHQAGASILYQLDHGFGGPRLSLWTFLRLFVAQMILLSPWVFFMILKVIYTCLKSPPAAQKDNFEVPGVSGLKIILCGTLPLIGVVFGASLFKEMMPHWLLPAWVLCVPLLAFIIRSQSVDDYGGEQKVVPVRRPLKWVALWQLTLLLPSIALSYTPLQTKILAELDQDPGALSELTLWQPLAMTVQKVIETSPSPWPHSPQEGATRCPQKPYLAAMRWYAVAQLRFHTPGHPRVFSLDPAHNSYYRDRDDSEWPEGCPVWVVALDSSLNWEELRKRVQIGKITALKVPLHERQPWILVQGVLMSVDHVVP